MTTRPAMRCYMSRRANGTYILSHKPPIRCRVGKSDHEDLYFAYGDAFCVRDLCEWQAKHIFGIVDLPQLATQEIYLSGGKTGEPFMVPSSEVGLYE